MRSVAASMLVDSCVLTSPPGRDSQGYTSTTWTTVGTYACRIDRQATRARPEQERHGSVESTAHYVLVLPYDCPVTEAMRASVNGETFEITTVDRFGTMPVETRCMVTRAL